MRVAIVGCGRMGRERAMAAASFGAQQILLFDEDVSRAKSLAKECPGAETLGDPEALFNGSLDTLFICTPPSSRGYFELRAIESGIPFFVEKPIGVTARQLRDVKDRLAHTAVLTAVDQEPMLQQAAEVLDVVVVEQHVRVLVENVLI